MVEAFTVVQGRGRQPHQGGGVWRMGGGWWWWIQLLADPRPPLLLSAGNDLPAQYLRLLAPPLQLLSAAVWQVVQQGLVDHYGILEEFVTMATELVPELMSYSQKAQLIMGLRARVSSAMADWGVGGGVGGGFDPGADDAQPFSASSRSGSSPAGSGDVSRRAPGGPPGHPAASGQDQSPRQHRQGPPRESPPPASTFRPSGSFDPRQLRLRFQETINLVEESEVNFVELVHSLLENPDQRSYFYQVRSGTVSPAAPALRFQRDQSAPSGFDVTLICRVNNPDVPCYRKSSPDTLAPSTMRLWKCWCGSSSPGWTNCSRFQTSRRCPDSFGRLFFPGYSHRGRAFPRFQSGMCRETPV